MRIDAKIQDGGLARALAFAEKSIRARAAKTVRAVSFAVEKKVKIDMPVDSGRARASWGHWTPASIIRYEMTTKKGKTKRVRADIWQGKRGSRADAHWAVKDDGLTIEQGSNVWYIARLNQGTSNQAPAGFIDKAADTGARELTNELQREVGGLL